MSKPLSEKAKPKSGIWLLVFLEIAGFALLYFLSVRPMLKIVDARHWNATPCVIVSSRVGRHQGSKGGYTYSVDLVYNYAASGQILTGERYEFLGGSSSGYAGKAKVVAQFPRGMHTICYVNPLDPSDAVIERGFTSDLWLGLLPLAMIGFGAFGIFSLRKKAKARDAAPWETAGMQHPSDFAAIPVAPIEIRPSSSPFAKFAGVSVFAIFWNGFILFVIVQNFQNRHGVLPDWGLALFMVPFVLVGVGLLAIVVSAFFSLFNPRIHLTISPGAVPLGEPFKLEWRTEGRIDRISRLRIWLEGSENATYQSGKNTTTAKNIFSTIEIVNTTSPEEFAARETSLTLPRRAMHSFDSGNNKIVWTIRVRGEIARWPDVAEDFPMAVLPLRMEARR